MAVKQKMLTRLEANRGDILSGSAVAQELGVSRAAVWKAVDALRREGHLIDSLPGNGYRLSEISDLLTPQALAAYMPPHSPPVQVLKEADSTNTTAKKWAIEGAPHGALVVTGRQNAGRGRLGRVFSSPPGGLYMSIVLRPGKTPGNPVHITAATAVCICRAVQKMCGISLGIKWVNDLFHQSKKCCGILTEGISGFENGMLECLVVGIGINYATPLDAFPPELEGVATSLFPGQNAPVPRAALAAEIHRQVLEEFARLGQKLFLEEYRTRSLVLGKKVTVAAQPPYSATAVGINEEAHLVVRRKDGREEVLSAGEISIRL